MPIIATRTDGPPAAGLYDPSMAKEQVMGVQEARDRWSEVTTAAEKDETRTVLVRRSKTTAVVVGAEWYRNACSALGEPTSV